MVTYANEVETKLKVLTAYISSATRNVTLNL